LRAWIESQQSMPCVFPYGRNLVTMGHVRRKPKLLANKLILIREHLGIVLVDMAGKLKAGSGRVSNYENGNSEPTLMELLVYARLGKVHLESIVDDEVSVDWFRKLLGKQNRKSSDRT
jgi:transcriptional regulator with XRE-family HTH domain